jgi:putative membrane protein
VADDQRGDADGGGADRGTPRRGGTSGAGPEPDYRWSLAAERTYLAYVRTALALLAGGVAVVGVLPDAGYVALRRAIGLLLVLAGLLLAATARSRWRHVDDAMRRGEPLPLSRTTVPVTVAVATAGVLAVVLVVLV